MKNSYLHFYAEKRNNQWMAFCLDLTLAAQADTFEEARDKLFLMVREYIKDATEGDDKEYAYQLLNRRAPISEWIKFYFKLAFSKIKFEKNTIKKSFMAPIPSLKKA